MGPESSKDRILVLCLLLTALGLMFWLARPQLLDCGIPGRREAVARAMISNLHLAAVCYEVGQGRLPVGNGQGSVALMTVLQTQGPPKRDPFYSAEMLDDRGSLINPAKPDTVVHYRCPGVRHPKGFDLWCEDSNGRADGINNWEK